MGATDYPVGAGPNSGGPREIAVQRAQEVEKLRQSIREAATRLFAKSGYHGTTVKQIADEVGISKQLLLYHFSSKEALRAAVLHELLQAWNELLPRVLDAVATPGDRSDEALDGLIEYFDEISALGRVAMLELMVGRQAVTGEGLDDAVLPWLRVAADFIRRRQADGSFHADIDPEATVVQVGTLLLSTLALLHLHAGEWPTDVSRHDWRRRRLREAIRMVRASLVATPGAPLA